MPVTTLYSVKYFRALLTSFLSPKLHFLKSLVIVFGDILKRMTVRERKNFHWGEIGHKTVSSEGVIYGKLEKSHPV